MFAEYMPNPTKSDAEWQSRSKPSLHLLLNVLQCPVVPLLLASRLVNLRSSESLGLNCRVVAWQN
jgi:hypothetical protein